MEGIILQNVKAHEIQSIRETVAEMKAMLSELMNRKNDGYISPLKAADKLDCEVQKIYRGIKSGEIPAKQYGKNYLIKVSDLESILTEVKSLKYRR